MASWMKHLCFFLVIFEILLACCLCEDRSDEDDYAPMKFHTENIKKQLPQQLDQATKESKEPRSAFFENGEPEFKTPIAIFRRDSRRKRDVFKDQKSLNVSSHTIKLYDNICRKHKLQLKFEDLGLWQILAPEAVDIYVCKGECTADKAPIANNHARLRRIAYERGLIGIDEAPCCVPTSYRPLHALYKDENDNVGFGNFFDSIVEECGCK